MAPRADTYNMSSEMRWCEDIGMFAIDRPINDIPEAGVEGSCVHRTDYCNETCYNVKLYKLYPAMVGKDVRNEQAWQESTGADYAAALDRKKKPTDRFRLMTRGEAIKDFGDIKRVLDICQANPNRLIWVPTRAWRSPLLRGIIEVSLFDIPNLAILASVDPDTLSSEPGLLASGWNTMFYGDDSPEVTAGRFFCPKTWKDIKGACGTCKAGCFAGPVLGRKGVQVHLKSH